MTINWINCAAGFGVGALVGLTGVGGGSLMAPIMILLFGVAPSTAVGTDLWFAATTKIFGAWIHGKKGTIDKQILRRMFCGSLPAAILTLIWLYVTGAGQSHSQLMFKTLGVTLILTSIAAVFRKRVHAFGERMRGSRPIEFKSLQPALTVLGRRHIGISGDFYLDRRGRAWRGDAALSVPTEVDREFIGRHRYRPRDSADYSCRHRTFVIGQREITACWLTFCWDRFPGLCLALWRARMPRRKSCDRRFPS